MSEKREFYAASVEEAIARAAKSVGVGEGELSYRVLDEGNSGFLGIGARDARIEVDVPMTTTEVRPLDDGPRAEPTPPEESPVAEPVAEPVSEETIEDSSGEDQTEAAEIAPEPQEDAEEIPAEVIEETEARITELLDAMGFDAQTEVYDAGGFVAVDVSTKDTALFIGQKGETIDALQYLVNASINRRKASRFRVVLDAEGYRQRRVEALQGMAHRTARKALREARAIELPPMNPAERRVVHLFLRDNPRVMTESEGEGDARRVRVLPA